MKKNRIEIHELKCLPEYFRAVVEQRKTFEVRENDRNFKINDLIILRDWSQDFGESGQLCILKILYILDNPDFCKLGLVIMGIEVVYEITH